MNALAAEIVPRTLYAECQCNSAADVILPCQDLHTSPSH
jgi:hypothetical protein